VVVNLDGEAVRKVSITILPAADPGQPGCHKAPPARSVRSLSSRRSIASLITRANRIRRGQDLHLKISVLRYF
jgi:hypothetical protein